MDWEPERYARNARFVAELGIPLLDMLAPLEGERILDVGCGDGALTRVIAARGCDVVGIDASPELIRAARDLGLDARVMDAQELSGATDLAGRFDAVFSNAALHWMPRQDDVIAGVARTLRPNGRFVAELGATGNVAGVIEALTAALAARDIDSRPLNPWTFPDPETMTRQLEGAGFAIDRLDHFPRPTPLPDDISGWLDTFARPFLDGLEPAVRRAVVDDVRERLAPTLFADDVWTLDYVRLRFCCRLSSVL